MKRKETFDEYQELVTSYRNDWDMVPQNLILKATEELGEIAELFTKGKKRLEVEQELLLELGDLLYQIVALGMLYDWTLEDIANYNMKKLEYREKMRQ